LQNKNFLVNYQNRFSTIRIIPEVNTKAIFFNNVSTHFDTLFWPTFPYYFTIWSSLLGQFLPEKDGNVFIRVCLSVNLSVCKITLESRSKNYKLIN